ncbi:glycerophosphodiester phosphodiesterase [Thermodesulfobacteriota bacterium]
MKNGPQQRRFLIPLIALLLTWGCGEDDHSGLTPSTTTYFSGPIPRNIGHRGGAGIFPENTLYAFAGALALGVQILEIDVHATSDGHVVILHDATVDRTTDGTGRVRDMPLDELRDLDAAYRFSLDGGETYPLRGRDITIPTLAEAFERFPEARFNIEIKQLIPPIEAEVVSLVEAHGMQEKVCLVSLSDSVVENVRRLNAEICTSPGILGIIAFMMTPLECLLDQDMKAEVLQVPEEELGIPIVTPAFIDKAHQLGLEVHVWTINSPGKMASLLGMGVDGIMTDYPDRLKDVIEEL